MKPIWSFLAHAFRRAAIYCALRACRLCTCAACKFVAGLGTSEAFHIEVVEANEGHLTKGAN